MPITHAHRHARTHAPRYSVFLRLISCDLLSHNSTSLLLPPPSPPPVCVDNHLIVLLALSFPHLALFLYQKDHLPPSLSSLLLRLCWARSRRPRSIHSVGNFHCAVQSQFEAPCGCSLVLLRLSDSSTITDPGSVLEMGT